MASRDAVRIMRKRSFVAAAFAASTLVACSDPGFDPTAEATESDGEPFNFTYAETWRLGRPISVCFMTAENSPEALRVRAAVESTWSRVAYVPFVGWDNCSAHQTAAGIDVDIRIAWSASGQVNSSAGNHSRDDLTVPSMNLRNFRGFAPPGDGMGSCYLDTSPKRPTGRVWATARNWCVDIEAIHEFGHAIGNRHEQVRLDTPGTCAANAGDGSPGDTYVGHWDPVSVDNYCNPIWNNDGYLSAHDIAGAQLLYRYGSKDFLYSMIGDVAGLARNPTYHGLVFDTLPQNISGDYNRPFTGDFDGDTHSDIFFYRTGSGADNLLYGEATAGSFTARNNQGVSGSYLPVVGRFDNGGTDDIYWYSPSGRDYVWYGQTDRTFDQSRSAKAFSRAGTFIPLAGDFDFDGYTDIFWYQPGSGADYIWWAGAGGFTEVATEVSGTYEPFVGDFDGDGRDDIFWYGVGSARDYVWYGSTSRVFEKLDPPQQVSGTYQPIVGDFDGDFASDIIWNVQGSDVSSATASDNLWMGRIFNRTPYTAHFSILGDFVPLVGDYDGNGTSDLFLYKLPANF